MNANLLDIIKIETVTEGDTLQVGWASDKKTATARHTYSVDVPHFPIPRTYIQFGDWYYQECGRCGASGNVGYGPDNGRCFLCVGEGTYGGGITIADLTVKITRWAKRAAAESRAADRRIAAVTAEREAWRASHSGLVTWAQELEPSKVNREDDSYTRVAATREEAETPEGREGERFVRSEQVADGWWALFVIDAKVFEQFGAKAAPMISRVRAGGMLDKRETAYLSRVRETAAKEAAERAPLADASRHAARPDTRMEITGRVVLINELEDEGYGARRLVITEGTGEFTGITWKTWTGARTVWDLNKGDAVKVKATVRHNSEYKGVRNDSVVRPVFTVLDEEAAAPAPAPAAAEAVTVAEAPQGSPAPRPRGGRREAQGASCVDGWELMYDKPRHAAQVVRHAETGKPGLACTRHGHVHELARQSDEGKARKAGGWCPACTA